MAHQLAQQYGMATISQGQEPRKHIECYKGTNVGIPGTPLSVMAASISGELRRDRGARPADQVII